MGRATTEWLGHASIQPSPTPRSSSCIPSPICNRHDHPNTRDKQFSCLGSRLPKQVRRQPHHRRPPLLLVMRRLVRRAAHRWTLQEAGHSPMATRSVRLPILQGGDSPPDPGRTRRVRARPPEGHVMTQRHGVPVWVPVALVAWTAAVAFTIKPDTPPAQPAPPAPPTIEETP